MTEYQQRMHDERILQDSKCKKSTRADGTVWYLESATSKYKYDDKGMRVYKERENVVGSILIIPFVFLYYVTFPIWGIFAILGMVIQGIFNIKRR
jgi:hypothetical protein